ncbi:biopolymer transporter ExbD [Kordiimonas sp.]|uniref:biopolymer transporter ExbD n=1 Tax=Kordiimonas sp. TaxID=1970157 RepID=UPI003A908FD2
MLKRQTSRRRASITSLIDVIFLLLLFFMLASTFTRYAEVEVVAAHSASNSKPDADSVMRIYIEPQSVLIDDKMVTDDEMPKLILAERRDPPLAVTISVANNVSTQRLVDILSRLSGVPGISLRLVEANTP